MKDGKKITGSTWGGSKNMSSKCTKRRNDSEYREVMKELDWTVKEGERFTLIKREDGDKVRRWKGNRKERKQEGAEAINLRVLDICIK